MLAAPAAAIARSDAAQTQAEEAYYSSYGEPDPLPAAAPAPAGDHAGTWRLVALGAGGLVLVLGAAELVTLGRLRRASAV